jgi:hypothetical protein
MQDIQDQQYDELRQQQLDCPQHEEIIEPDGRIFCYRCDKYLGKAKGINHATNKESNF